MDRCVGAAARLPESGRKNLAVQALARSETVSDLATRHGVSRNVHAARQQTLELAFQANPERFVNKPPTPPDKPTAAWIDPPTPNSRA